VTAAIPERRSVQEYADFTGTTRAIEYAEVRARVNGTLEDIRFRPGSIVKAGDVLFVIERDRYQARYDEALGNLRAAEAELSRAESDLERVEQAVKTDAVSRSDLDRARADRDRAAASVISSKARLDDAELNLEYCTVRAPIPGRVGRNVVDEGNLVGATGPDLLTTVNRIDSIYVYFSAAELLVLRMLESKRKESAGRVSVSLANEADFPHEGIIDFVDNAVDPTTGTIEIRAVLANPDTTLFPGLFVRIRAWGALKPDVIVVEERAVGADMGGKYVFVVGDGNIVEQRYVTLGSIQEDGMVVVEEGLDGSEQYIVNGMLRARPGLPVTPETRAEVTGAAETASERG
jgi:RND family efflux transporter MFP subunit